MDLFDKCRAFTRPQEIQAAGLYPYFKPIEASDGTRVVIEGRERIMAGSNNYLGLTVHPDVKAAAIDAVQKYGTSCTGSRYLNGTLDLHVELEQQLAAFLNKEACVLLSTGFQTNLGLLQTIASKGDFILSDKENHSSIVVGTQASYATTVRYRHNDMRDLENKLSKLPEDAGKLIVSDGVFSMSGALVNLPALVDIARRYGARIALDDAHGTGVIGEGGRGTASHFGLVAETDIITGTFSKSFASLGGFIAGDREVISYLKHNAAALIFSASMTPASTATVIAALKVMQQEPERIARLKQVAERMRRGFMEMGFRVIDGETAIVPVVIGEDEATFRFWQALYKRGVFVNCVISPAVPRGMSLIRTSYIATHSDEELDLILEAFYQTGREMGLIGQPSGTLVASAG